jgi:hypothetical protein
VDVEDDDIAELDEPVSGSKRKATGRVEPSAKKPRTARAKAKAPKEESESEQDSSDLDDAPLDMASVLRVMGVKQQGEVSKSHGKQYLGPGSYKEKRAEQVTREGTNLVLNRLTEEHRVANRPYKEWAGGYKAEVEARKEKLPEAERNDKTKLAAIRARARKKHGKPPPQSKIKPVEIQMSMLANRLLINSNSPEGSKKLAEGLKEAGSLQRYLDLQEAELGGDHPTMKPVMDSDKLRPQRYHMKLGDGIDQNRPWQQDDAEGESPEDVARANAVLAAMEREGVGELDPNDPKKIKKAVSRWHDDDAPSVYVVHHAKNKTRQKNFVKNKHAERVQNEVRKEHLSELEGQGESMPPFGPKTPCLGCESTHRADFSSFVPEAPYSGAYFKGSSPAQTPEQVKVAHSLATSRPATGSVSVFGGIRNSDHQDSDSDEEGIVRPLLPRTMHHRFGEQRPSLSFLRGGKKVAVSDSDLASMKKDEAARLKRRMRSRSKTASSSRKSKTSKSDEESSSSSAEESAGSSSSSGYEVDEEGE